MTDEPETPPPWPKGPCGCRNHRGRPKIKYRTREAALTAVLTRHLRHGPHEVVKCKRHPGVVWHVRSRRTR